MRRLDQEKKLQGARLEQQRLIGIQARAAYQSGQQEYLKLLLNQQHPEKFARTLTYYDYLSQARLEQLDAFNGPCANWPTSSATSPASRPRSSSRRAPWTAAASSSPACARSASWPWPSSTAT